MISFFCFCTGVMSYEPMTIGGVPFIFNDLTMKGFWLGKWRNTHTTEEIQKMFDDVADLMLKQNQNKDIFEADYEIVKFSEWSNKPFFQPEKNQKKKIVLDFRK